MMPLPRAEPLGLAVALAFEDKVAHPSASYGIYIAGPARWR
jgi:hypothetical protein